MKPKYTTEQLLEAIQASPFDLVVKSVEGSRVTVGLRLSWTCPVTLDVDECDVYSLPSTERYRVSSEETIMSSIRTALHILFDNKEASY